MYDAQAMRKANDSRIDSLEERGIFLPKDPDSVFEEIAGKEAELEKAYEKAISQYTRKIRVWSEWLDKVKGIGPRLGGSLLGQIRDPGRFLWPGKLWAYAGLTVRDGHLPRLTHGVKANWNNNFRWTCSKVSDSLVRCTSQYKSLFDTYREYLIQRTLRAGQIIWTKTRADGPWEVAFSPREAVIPDDPGARPEWTLGRISSISGWRMTKIFLSHLLTVWRVMEGLPVYLPYPQDRLGHESFIDPWAILGMTPRFNSRGEPLDKSITVLWRSKRDEQVQQTGIRSFTQAAPEVPGSGLHAQCEQHEELGSVGLVDTYPS